MIALRGRAEASNLQEPIEHAVWLLVDARTVTSQRLRRAYVIAPGESPPEGFALYLTHSDHLGPTDLPWVSLPPILDHLEGGDAVSISERGDYVRVMWRHRSRQNSVLLTERCDHYCLMCSQPPKQGPDDWLLRHAFELVRLLPRTTRDINFTGGEPTIYGLGFVELMRLCKSLLPFAAVHILSNGRRFEDWAFAAAYASVRNPQMMVGIPLYGAEPALHDYVVQSVGAFDDTVRGILNLAHLRQRIELRVVLHAQTAPHLPEIADFIARNLPFVEQVALMGLEMTGFARANVKELWIDPIDYQAELVEAVRRLDRRRVRTMIYNHQLCLLDRELWPFAVRSISDWKNEYHPECQRCAVAESCGGFFHSAKHRFSDHIRAIPRTEMQLGSGLLPVP